LGGAAAAAGARAIRLSSVGGIQTWHSAIELKRYFLRFIQEFPRMHTLAGVRRTVYNQYHSITVPLQRRNASLAAMRS